MSDLKPVYVHLDYDLYPDIRMEGCPLAGEGFWTQPREDGTYVVDNLLNTTLVIGYGDVIRCEDQGTDWGDREFAEVLDQAVCWRFLLAAPEGVDEGVFIRAAAGQIKERWPESATEGGMGMLMIQSSLADGPAIRDWVEGNEWPCVAVSIEEKEDAT